jgi:hypothetical protein
MPARALEPSNWGGLAIHFGLCGVANSGGIGEGSNHDIHSGLSAGMTTGSKNRVTPGSVRIQQINDALKEELR